MTNEMTNEMTEERLAELRVHRNELSAALERGNVYESGTWAMMNADAVDEIDRLRAEIAARDAEVERLKVTLSEVAIYLECQCDEAYTKRGRHEPNALCHLLPEVQRALNPEPQP